MSYYYQGSPAYYQQPAYGNSTLQQPFAPRGQSHYNYAATSIPQTSAYYSAPYPPPQPTRQMSPPAQQPQQELNDPNVFRSYFRSGLAALTSNSRPIIQDLTTLAHQYLLRMSTVISDELLNHIRHVGPQLSQHPQGGPNS